MATARIELPPKLIPVFSGPADVRWSCGGRGSGKTRSFALMAAVYGYRYGQQGIAGQILCARQYMNSLDDSSLAECKRAIEDTPWLAAYYDIGEKYIKSRDGRIWFAFAGLDRNIGSIKSKGRILLAWVDEAEPVTKQAWDILIPTLREEGDDWNAELWVTWNPARKSAEVEARFRRSADPLVKGAVLNWRDNPRFPAKLERERQRALAGDRETYGHVWEGAFGAVAGSILGRWMDAAEREGRINDAIRYDPQGAPVEISCDLGRRDTATWWFWQPVVGGYHVIDHLSGSGMDADEWCDQIEQRLAGRTLGTIHMPHDARAKTFTAKRSAEETFALRFGWGKVRVIRVTSKADRINAARQLLPKVAFSRANLDTANEAGDPTAIDALRAWRYEWNPDTQTYSSEPLHDWASHEGDGFSYGCQVMQEIAPPKETDKRIVAGVAATNEQARMGMTINDVIRRRAAARRASE